MGETVSKIKSGRSANRISCEVAKQASREVGRSQSLGGTKMEKIKQIGFKKHLMTAISFFLPIIVASVLLAIGNMMGGASIENFRDGFSFADTMTTMGGYGLGFLPMIVSTAIAYSIGDKPGLLLV